jgi:hypothetical protein
MWSFLVLAVFNMVFLHIYPLAHAHVLANLEARVGEKAMVVPWDMLERRSFAGLTFVGITTSLTGRDRLLGNVPGSTTTI